MLGGDDKLGFFTDELVVLNSFTDDEERNRDIMVLFSCLVLITDLEIFGIGCLRLTYEVVL